MYLLWISGTILGAGNIAVNKIIKNFWFRGATCSWWDFFDDSAVKNSPASQETQVWSLSQQDAQEKKMATPAITPAWENTRTEGPGASSLWGNKELKKTKQLNCNHYHDCDIKLVYI